MFPAHNGSRSGSLTHACAPARTATDRWRSLPAKGVDALGRPIICVVAKNYSSSGISHERTLLYLIHQLDGIVNKVRRRRPLPAATVQVVCTS